MKKILLVILLSMAVDASAQAVKVTTRNQSLTVNAGPNQTITLPAQATLNGSVVAKPGSLKPVITWLSSGSGAVTFSNPSSAVTTASFTTAGIYVLSLTGTTPKMHATSYVTVTVNGPVIPPNPNPTPKTNTLSWEAVAPTPTAPVDGYNLYKTDGGCDDPSTFIKANAQLITTIPYIDDPTPAAALCYFVRAVNSIGESGPSNIIWVPTKN